MITFTALSGGFVIGILIVLALIVMTENPIPSTKVMMLVFGMFGLAIVVFMLTFRDVSYSDDGCDRITVNGVRYIEERCEDTE